MTCQDLLFPRIANDTTGSAIEKFSEQLDESYEVFINLWKQSVVEGKFQRFGSKVPKNQRKLAVNDFVLISLPAETWKYGIIKGFESPHHIKMRMLVRRYKDGSGEPGHQILDITNVVHLFRP